MITADSAELPAFPFVFMTGHKLVRFSAREREGLQRFVERGGLLFSDDCNHDVAGLYAVSLRARDADRSFPGRRRWRSCPARIRSTRRSSTSRTGRRRPRTS